MILYYLITRYLYPGQKIFVYCNGVPCIMNERCHDVIRNDKYEVLMDKAVIRILTDNTPDTIVIYVQ